MSITEQAKDIAEGLAAWATAEKGKAFVASNIHDMWNQAFARSDGPRAIVAYNGETVRGDFGIAAILGRVDRNWMVAVTRGQGAGKERGAQLTETIGNARPFYDLVEEARDIIRTFELDANFCERPIDFKGIRTMQMVNGQILDGYIIDFSVGTQLGRVAAQPSSAATP